MGPRSLMQRPEFLRHVFRPELIMRHQNDINLTPAQQESITQAMGETQKKLVDLRWRSEAESQTLSKLLEGDTIDEAAALAQFQKVMSIEQQIKQEHLGMLIRIKNQLTPEQQAKLLEVRPDRRRRQFRR
jgi:Spy/CpxP family protein refolding chaperone